MLECTTTMNQSLLLSAILLLNQVLAAYQSHDRKRLLCCHKKERDHNRREYKEYQCYPCYPCYPPWPCYPECNPRPPRQVSCTVTGPATLSHGAAIAGGTVTGNGSVTGPVTLSPGTTVTGPTILSLAAGAVLTLPVGSTLVGTLLTIGAGGLNIGPSPGT